MMCWCRRNRVIKGGPWCFPHHPHKTWNTRSFWSDENNHKTDSDMTYSKEGKITVKVDCSGGLPWILNDTTNDLEELIQWGRDQTSCKGETIHSLNWLKGVKWLMKVDRVGDKLNTQLFEMQMHTSAMFKGGLWASINANEIRSPFP